MIEATSETSILYLCVCLSYSYCPQSSLRKSALQSLLKKLHKAKQHHIPKIPASALKHYWSAALDDLKQSCIQAHELWVSAGKPGTGDIFELKKNAKYKYKLAKVSEMQHSSLRAGLMTNC
jgi:hypothetical protein